MSNSYSLKKNIKESLLTGLIALAIFGPIVGLRTRLQKEGLFIDPEWLRVIFLVCGCALIKFLININWRRSYEKNIFINCINVEWFDYY